MQPQPGRLQWSRVLRPARGEGILHLSKGCEDWLRQTAAFVRRTRAALPRLVTCRELASNQFNHQTNRDELYAMSWFDGLMVRSAGGVGRLQFLPQLLQLVESAACVCARARETMCLASAIDLPRCWTCRPRGTGRVGVRCASPMEKLKPSRFEHHHIWLRTLAGSRSSSKALPRLRGRVTLRLEQLASMLGGRPECCRGSC